VGKRFGLSEAGAFALQGDRITARRVCFGM
jgi:hypothetical protein